ncbi:MAG: ribonuclease HII [Methanospirillaceae archaeon]|nr:ribonuclease HII [Methanospirillaceae archaeon]
MICGIDEAGKGSVLGPMVIGAVGCDSQDEIQRTGVRDSKVLSRKMREKVYETITGKFPSFVVILTARDIDTRRETMTMNHIVASAHAEAILAIGADIGFVDACDVNEERYEKTLAGLVGEGCRIIAKHRADSLFPVVSAASVVAKVTRDRIIESLWEEWGDFGSGYPSDKKTVDFLLNYIRSHGTPPPIARISWATTRELCASCSQKSLFDF